MPALATYPSNAVPEAQARSVARDRGRARRPRGAPLPRSAAWAHVPQQPGRWTRAADPAVFVGSHVRHAVCTGCRVCRRGRGHPASRPRCAAPTRTSLPTRLQRSGNRGRPGRSVRRRRLPNTRCRLGTRGMITTRQLRMSAPAPYPRDAASEALARPTSHVGACAASSRAAEARPPAPRSDPP
jgi:hypothetical protein